MTAAIVSLITLYEGLIILRAVTSWFVSRQNTHPLVDLLHRVTDPVLEPVRNVLPVSSGIDLSPLIVLVGLELIKRVIS